MRIRAWWKTQATSVDSQGQPWMEKRVSEDETATWVRMSLTGEPPESVQVRVMVGEKEWPVLKARIDAAFAGEDPNRTEFYDQDVVYAIEQVREQLAGHTKETDEDLDREG